MTSVTVQKRGTSRAIPVGSLGSVVTLTPNACLAKVQYTDSPLSDIENGTATWADWPAGYVTTQHSDTLLKHSAVRVVSIDGAATLTVEDAEWEPAAYASSWLSTFTSAQKDATPRGLRVAMIGDSITGQNMYRVTATSITQSNGIATMTASAHGLFPLGQFYIGGADDNAYNGFGTVLERVSTSVFTYRIDPSAPATAGGSNISVVNQQRFQDRCWFEMANATLGHPFTQVGCAGVSGGKIVTIARRFDLDVLALSPDAAIIQGGVNDITGTAVGDEATSLIAIKAAFVSMIEKSLAAGVIPIVTTCFPLSSTATNYSAARGQMLLNLNQWIREIALTTYPRMVVFDGWQAAVDPTSATGNWQTNYSADGIHPTAFGAQRIAAAFVTVLTKLAIDTPQRVGSIFDTYDNDSTNPQLFPNPLMQGTGGTKTTTGAGAGTNTGNVPDLITVQWNRGGAGTVVNSIVSRSDGIGSDHQMVVTSTNSGDAVQVNLISAIQARVSEGDVISSEIELVMTGITALTSISYWIVWTVDGNAFTSPSAIAGSGSGVLSDNISMVLRTPPFKIPPGSVTNFVPRFTATFSGAGGATIKLGRQSVTKLQTA